jgi:hypothetical protein
MGLPSELNPSVRPNRIQGTAFAGPEPDEADKLLARVRKNREDALEAQNQKPAPAPARISASEARRLNSIAKQQDAERERQFNAQTERTLDMGGVKHRVVAGGGVEPKVTANTRGLPSLEYGAGETPNDMGGVTKYDEFGTPKIKPEIAIKIAKGNKEFGEDPNALYRVPTRLLAEGATPEQEPTRKSVKIGLIDDLTDSDDEAVRTFARGERVARDKQVYDGAFSDLKATEEILTAELGLLNSQIEADEKNFTLTTDPTANAAALKEQDERKRQGTEKEEELKRHRLLQAELKTQKEKEATFNALMQRGQDVRRAGIVKADGTKSNNPEDDKIYKALQKSASELGLGDLDPAAPALPKELAGMIPVVVDGKGSGQMMIGLPDTEEARAVRQQAEKAKKTADANLENRKQKLTEYADSISRPASDARAVWNLLVKKKDLAIAQHNQLLKSGATQSEIDASNRAIDIMEADLKAKQPAVISANQSQADAQQLQKETIEQAKQEVDEKKQRIDYEANKAASAVSQRKYLSGEAIKPRTPDINPEAQVDSVMDLARNKEVPTKFAVELIKQNKMVNGKFEKVGAERLINNVINQTIKGSIRFNQDQARGFYTAVGRTLGSKGEFFINAGQAAKENRDFFDEMFPTTDDFNASIGGGILKSVSELPAQMMTYVAASRMGPVASYGLGYLGNASALYAEAIADQEISQQKTGIALTPSQSHLAALIYALPRLGWTR